ncbi:MAG: DUF928 domain-containing protein [Cyanobacteria bacterium P01_F01_bin.86]
MRKHYPASPKFKLFLATLCWSSLFGLNLQPASAQIETVVNFDPPPMSSPGNREAGGQRSDTCVDTRDTTGLVALVPNTNVGLTTEASPNLLAYVPPNSAQRAELRILKEVTGEEVFTGEVSLPEANTDLDYRYQAAILNMPLTSGAVVLEPDTNYLWALMLVCNSDNRAEDIVVDVIVQRIGEDYLNTLPSDITGPLANVSSFSGEDKLTAYSSAGVWHDLLLELSVLRQENPGLYESTWAGLLTNQGMDKIANAPIYESSLQPLNP